MLYNQFMYIQDPPFPQAQLVISTRTLDFGILTKDEPSEGHGIATLIIANEGEKTLVGRIALQVAWVSVTPPDFRINPGESSEHVFRIRTNAESSWTTHKLGSNFIALINSNGGSETIGGFYYSDPSRNKPKKNPIKLWTILSIPIALVMIAGMIYFLSNAAKASKVHTKLTSIAQTYTQAAQTYMASIAAETTLLPVSAVIDETKTGEAPLLEPSATSSIQQPTYTPWPVASFPNVEEFIRSYYSALQNDEYEKAWWMLSEKMQIACCYQGGTLPFDIYTAYWKTVDYVEVVYAYLQAYDVNPAEVNVALIYHNADGTSEEAYNTFYIIADAVRNTLLIDEIK